MSFDAAILAHLSKSEDDVFDVDCPICLEAMTPSDHDHPIQCKHHCGFNFCVSCIQSLISSSKDDYMEASDGNMHVKVFLNCPNCRSDLSESIRDTVLLRRADSSSRCKEAGKPLTESNQRMEKAMKDPKVQTALEEARAREANFFCVQEQESPPIESGDSFEDTCAQDESWGVEACLDQGVHDSFYSPSSSLPPQQEGKMLVDKTLFSGSDRHRREEQLQMLTALLTSGDVNDLVKAAHILKYGSPPRHAGNTVFSPRGSMLLAASPRGSVCSRRMSVMSAGSGNGQNAGLDVSRRGSIYALLSEAEQAKRSKGGKSQVQVSIIEALMEIEREADLLRTHPLPVRMPKSILLSLDTSDSTTTSLPLSFCDDTWDGTVKDAFCKIHIGLFKKVTQHTTHHPGVSTILNSDGPVRIDTEHHRVLIASVRPECGSQGAMKGDVVSHVNGKVIGDCTAEELVTKIKSLGGKVQLVLNADPAVAQALKLRSIAALDYEY